MSRLDLELDPELERLGQALHVSAAVDLAREERATRSAPAGPGRVQPALRGRAPWTGLWPRAFAGGTLGLAGVGAALLIGLGGTGATSAAFAVTREADGSVLVKVNVDAPGPWVAGADRKLAAMGIDEQIAVGYGSGSAARRGPVACTPLGKNATTPVKVLLGTAGTQVIPAGTTGAGTTVHISNCAYFTSASSGSGNTGAGSSASPSVSKYDLHARVATVATPRRSAGYQGRTRGGRRRAEILIP